MLIITKTLSAEIRTWSELPLRPLTPPVKPNTSPLNNSKILSLRKLRDLPAGSFTLTVFCAFTTSARYVYFLGLWVGVCLYERVCLCACMSVSVCLCVYTLTFQRSLFIFACICVCFCGCPWVYVYMCLWVCTKFVHVTETVHCARACVCTLEFVCACVCLCLYFLR